jgi:hypothetical protein
MDTHPAPINRILLRGVLNDVTPIVARVLSVPDDLDIRDLHDVFLAMLDWDYDPDFIIRIHGQEFASFRRRVRGTRLRDFQLRRQEKFLYICDTLDLWEWELRVLDVEPIEGETVDIVCMKGRGAAPPAMCGGPTGYRLMLTRQQAGRPSKTRWARRFRAKPRIPATEDFLQIVVEHTSPSLQEEMCAFGRPLHLLSLDEALADDLIDG